MAASYSPSASVEEKLLVEEWFRDLQRRAIDQDWKPTPFVGRLAYLWAIDQDWKPTPFVGRLAYLWAIDEVWKPAPLKSLEGAAEPIKAWLRLRYDLPVLPPDADDEREARRSRIALLFFGWRWPRWSELLNGGPEAPRAALIEWRSQYHISEADVWIMDAALHTILQGLFDEAPLQWFYVRDALWPAFCPKYHVVLLDDDDLATEQKRIEKELVNTVKRQWRAYCTQIKADRGDRRANLYRDALLTARHLAGESYEDIAWSLDTPEDRVNEDTVRMAVRAFAKYIDLTLADTLARPDKKPAYKRRKQGNRTRD